MRVRDLFILLILVSLFASCQKPVAVVESTFPDGLKRHVVYYTISGTDSTRVKESFFYKSGALYLEGNLKEGERDGLWKSFREDGQIWSQANYSIGKEQGVSKTYHDNGNIYYEGSFRDGKRVGVWHFYKKNGSSLKTIDYDKSVKD